MENQARIEAAVRVIKRRGWSDWGASKGFARLLKGKPTSPIFQSSNGHGWHRWPMSETTNWARWAAFLEVECAHVSRHLHPTVAAHAQGIWHIGVRIEDDVW